MERLLIAVMALVAIVTLSNCGNDKDSVTPIVQALPQKIDTPYAVEWISECPTSGELSIDSTISLWVTYVDVYKFTNGDYALYSTEVAIDIATELGDVHSRTMYFPNDSDTIVYGQKLSTINRTGITFFIDTLTAIYTDSANTDPENYVEVDCPIFYQNK